MRAGNRWLLVCAGRHLLAVPFQQVRRLVQLAADRPATSHRPARRQMDTAPRPGMQVAVQPAAGTPGEDAGAMPVLSLGECLSCGEDPPDGLVIWTGTGVEQVGIRVRSVLEMVEGPEMTPMPLLLRRALPDDAPAIGALVWQNRPLVVVDLHRVRQCSTHHSPEGE